MGTVARKRGMTQCAAIPISGQDYFAGGAVSARRLLSARYVARMISHLKFASIPVRDQNRALDFYTEKLGFTIVTDKPFDGKQRWIELRIPKAETRVVLFTPEEHVGRIGTFSGLSFACDDVEKTY